MCVQAFLEEGSEDVLSCDWVKAELLRPFPPPTPEGFLQRLTHGDEVEILHEDGWWDVTFIGLRHSEGGVEYQVLVRCTLVCVSFGCMATELLLCSTIRVGAIRVVQCGAMGPDGSHQAAVEEVGLQVARAGAISA